MKKIYCHPSTSIFAIQAERPCAGSDKLGRGQGSGGNNAEVKAERGMSGQNNSVDWDDWE